MSNYFEENRKFLGLSGVLGRRDFIINCVIIEIIEALICSTPIVYFMLCKPSLVSGFSHSGAAPEWYLQWVAAAGLLSSIFYFSSILRRVRDIIGVEDDNKVNLIAGILTVFNFISYLPLGFIGKLIGFSILVYLAIQSGVITGSKPKSEIIRFNWGAFFATWLWGLFNRSWITLFMIPLFFTFAGFPFMILCGLKGNEWAYKNKKYDDIAKFHESQSNQAVIWLVLIPILSVLFNVFIIVASGVGLYKFALAHPEFKTKMSTVFNEYQTTAIESGFDKIEVQDGVYKFYTNPEDWANLPQTLKTSQFKNAILYVLTKEGKSVIDSISYIDYVEVLNNVKIYSIFNNEVLAEYYMDPAEAKKIKEELKEKKILAKEVRYKINDGYKFNNNPTLP